MQSQLTSLANPRWVNAEQTLIDCEITTSQFGNEVLPFTASANDCEAHGRGIFADIVAGVYGEIGAYVPPPSSPKSTATPSSGEISNSVL
jgi:hypothetical protein